MTLEKFNKISKLIRTKGQFVSHGDFRRYLYEATVITMGCSPRDRLKAQNEGFFVFRTQFEPFDFC